MLSDEVIDKVIERLVNRIEQGNTYVLEQIAKSIKKIGTLSPTNAQRLIQVFKYGGDYQKIVKQLAKITNLNVRDIYKIFEEIARNDYEFAKQFYDYRKVKYIPFDENIALQRQINAIAEMTAKEYVNIARTSAIGFSIRDKDKNIIFQDLSKTYNDAIDKAILNVAQGKTTFQEEMYDLMNQLGSSGLRVLDYENGRTLRLDSAIRMHIKDNIRSMHNEMQQQIGKEFGSDGVEITVHLSPAPDHALVQGKQFSTKRPSKNELSEFEKFQSDEDSYSYDGTFFSKEHNGHDRRSIGQYNCYHYTFAIILGVNKPQYSNEQLQEILEKNEKGFDFDGKHYTFYEGEQLQRKLETEIRKQKDLQIMGKTSDNEKLKMKSQKKINQLTKKYNELSLESGLPKKPTRLRVSKYRKSRI